MKNLPNPTSKILKFTPIKKEDAEYLFPLAKDPEVTQYLTWDATTKEDMAKFYTLEKEKFRKGINYSFLVSIASSNIPIGSGSLSCVNLEHKSTYIGYWIGKKYWNEGYGTELVKSLVCFGFAYLNLHRIYSRIMTENLASVRILEKAGFRKEGHTVQSFWGNGKFHDQFWYAILREEFRASNIHL